MNYTLFLQGLTVGILIASFLSDVIFFALLKEENAIDTVAAEGDGKNYILAGLDEAGNNTDMLLLVSVKEKGNHGCPWRTKTRGCCKTAPDGS